MSSPGRPHWVRHADFYVGPGEIPGQPGPEPQAQEIHRHAWGPLKQAPSYPLVLFIRLWRWLISPLYGQVCSFYPSCSAYGLEAVTVHGLAKGSAFTAWRILRCNPWTGGGVDHVPPSGRMWPEDRVPAIVRTNHPPMDDDAQL
ncbi:membrane protein insertion efficiency factor YidD [Nesterenkonia flava]|uniref:Putative membrane protein insertion efficiency factor n=1 Tax=Nesterenkonia flava TaxID=469799 RepID=A0ABU1FT13_9MICC|nr:membrane protein insertion efficiency factor YidD [Nesterenkonia flava]MDR5711795.1 membrane protein insertion efficiency factor YidD [Nesterenkonia flava]